MKYSRRVFALSTLAAVSAAALALSWALRASLPDLDGVHALPGLDRQAQVEFDALGIPKILAHDRDDAYRVLGFVTARERLFQMDLLRRRTAGRLAEVLGAALAASDRRHRLMGFEDVARRILQRLPDEQKQALAAYAAGVNQAVAAMTALPPEFLALAYGFSAWRPEDSLLVVLAMGEELTWSADAERMATIMAAALPPRVYAFFTPAAAHPSSATVLPKAELAALLTDAGVAGQPGLIAPAPAPQGSNAWVVGPGRTRHGRAMLANDMHLTLGVPNLWYRAELRYGPVELTGFTLPGVPLLIAGSNGRIAWGFTSIQGDFIDLVTLELDAADAGRYLTPQGYRRFGERVETIRVRGGADVAVPVRTTQWGPVAAETLLGKPVAVNWTLLDPAATDLGLLDLDLAGDVPAALAVFNRAGSPPLNALVADAGGHIGWSYTGKIPRRFGLDGLTSRSWADGTRGWDGYIPPGELPRRVDPPQGFIVNANQPMVTHDAAAACHRSHAPRGNAVWDAQRPVMFSAAFPLRSVWENHREAELLRLMECSPGHSQETLKIPLRGDSVFLNRWGGCFLQITSAQSQTTFADVDATRSVAGCVPTRSVGTMAYYPHVIGHGFDNGYRASRIAERLGEMQAMDEHDLFALQLDTRAGFYRYYQQLALSLLDADAAAEQRIKANLAAWDGRAEPDSAGLAILVEFRRRLIEAVIPPYLEKCRRLDARFSYFWPTLDLPLQQLLETQAPELLPAAARFPDWRAWLRGLLLQAAAHAAPVWGETSQALIAHPLSAALPALGAWLDMPPESLAGCAECVRLHEQRVGADERLVVAPGHESAGILHMPGGQSGHPLSPHYRDQQAAWAHGRALLLRAGPALHKMTFIPGVRASCPPLGPQPSWPQCGQDGRAPGEQP